MSRLKDVRDEIGLTRLKLSELSGVSLRMIEKYENGEKDLLRASFETVYRLASSLDVSPVKLFSEKELILSMLDEYIKTDINSDPEENYIAVSLVMFPSRRFGSKKRLPVPDPHLENGKNWVPFMKMYLVHTKSELIKKLNCDADSDMFVAYFDGSDEKTLNEAEKFKACLSEILTNDKKTQDILSEHKWEMNWVVEPEEKKSEPIESAKRFRKTIHYERESAMPNMVIPRERMEEY